MTARLTGLGGFLCQICDLKFDALGLTSDKALYRTLFLNPELRAGEAYMDGTLTVDGGIRDLLEVFAYNRDGLRKHPLQKTLKGWLKKIRRYHQRNKTSASRKNVQQRGHDPRAGAAREESPYRRQAKPQSGRPRA